MCPLIEQSARIGIITDYTQLRKTYEGALYGQFQEPGQEARDTQLRAFEIIKVLYAEDIWNTWLYVRVAGMGTGYIKADGGFYETPVDYVNARSTSPLTGTYWPVKDKLRGHFTFVSKPNYGYFLYRYGWRDNNVSGSSVYAHVTYNAMTGQFFVEAERADEYPYVTREECILANKIAVVNFDDDPVPEEQEWIVNLPKQVSVKAPTAEDAEAIVKESIARIVHK